MNQLATYATARPYFPDASSFVDGFPDARRSINTTDGLVSVIAKAWGMSQPELPYVSTTMSGGPRQADPPAVARDRGYASPKLRDEFLGALESGNAPLALRLAADLTGCGNPLPGMTCIALRLPHGSTYGRAARHVLAMDAIGLHA